MEEIKNGLRITTLPDRVKIGAINEEGLIALKTWISIDKDPTALRQKLEISEEEYPIFKHKFLQDGTIFMVEFKKED